MTTRIYYPTISFDIPLSDNILLEGNSAHHLISVLRRKVGDAVILFDGQNQEYHTLIEKLEKKRLWLTLQEKIMINRESPLSIHLIQAISKGDRMDWVVQKATELGISRITPILTQHGAVKLEADRMAKKVDHWQSIAISACEQSERNVVPVIEPICRFSDVLMLNAETQNAHTLSWILHCRNIDENQFQELSNTITHAKILIGPEGGFSESEVSEACKAGYIIRALGPRILRTETAAIAAISVLQTHFGDWS